MESITLEHDSNVTPMSPQGEIRSYAKASSVNERLFR